MVNWIGLWYVHITHILLCTLGIDGGISQLFALAKIFLLYIQKICARLQIKYKAVAYTVDFNRIC